MQRNIAGFQFVPGTRKQIKTTITLSEKNKSILLGYVMDKHKRPIPNAIVKLYEISHKKLTTVFYTFTDRNGKFLFGPLIADHHYVVKVYQNSVFSQKIFLRKSSQFRNEYHHSSANEHKTYIVNTNNETNNFHPAKNTQNTNQ